MSARNDGGFAFPRESMMLPDQPGMSLRDWFAGQALAGWLASFPEHASPDPKQVSMFAYAMADAMLAERARAALPAATKEDAA